MAERDDLEQQRASNPVVKPALATLLLAGSAGLYAFIQSGDKGEPQAPAEPAAGGKIASGEAAGPASTAPAAADVAPEFGKPAPAVAEAPAQSITESLTSAASSAAASVKQTVKGAIAAAIPPQPSRAVQRIEFPAPASEPGPVQRIVLPDPVPASAPVLAEAAPKTGDAEQSVPAAAAVAAVEEAPSLAEKAQTPPVEQQFETVAAVVPQSVTPLLPAPAEQPPLVQAFADAGITPLSEARLADLRPIGGASSVPAPMASAPASARPAARLATSRATAASQPRASTKLATKAPRAGVAERPSRLSGLRATAARPGLNGYRMVGNVIEFKMPVKVNGERLGALTMHIAPDDEISLHLKELVSMFEEQLDPQLVNALKASPSIDEFVSFERLRAAGINIRYDAASNHVILAADQS